MADSRVEDLDAHLVGLGRRHLDVLDAEILAGFPGHGGLASDGLLREDKKKGGCLSVLAFTHHLCNLGGVGWVRGRAFE